MNIFIKIIVPFFLVLCLIFVVQGKITEAREKSSDLSNIIDKVEKENGTVQSWSYYTREQLSFSSRSDWMKKANKLQSQYPQYKWVVDGSKGIATGTHEDHGIHEIIKVLTNSENVNASYIIYELSGTNWNKKVEKDINKRVSKNFSTLYTKNPEVFSCVKGVFNDKIDKVLSAKSDRLLNEFQATETESLKEKNFYSISAYSKQFEESIHSNKKAFNMQVGLRNDGLGSKTTFVIGTPIITIEY